MNSDSRTAPSSWTGTDFGNHPRSGWADGTTARLLWARRHLFAPGQTLFSPDVPSYALWLVLEGEVQVEWRGAEHRGQAGQAFWGAPCLARRLTTPSGARWLSAGLRVQLAHGDDALANIPIGFFVAGESARVQLERLLSFSVEASGWSGTSGELAIGGAARALAGWMFQHRGGVLPDFARWSGEQAWVGAALEHIEREPGVSVAQLAQNAHFSPAQFRRLFARHVGMSPRDYLHRRRLEEARRLLEQETVSVAEVAMRAGWNQSAQLSREFKNHFGTSPLSWRRAVREGV